MHQMKTGWYMVCSELYAIIGFRFTIRTLHAIAGRKSCFVSGNNVLLQPKKYILAPTIACIALTNNLKTTIIKNSKYNIDHPVFISHKWSVLWN